MKRMVFLIGFMGCGKTHWARRLAALLGQPWYDLDEMIELSLSMPVKQVFEKTGEDGFRAAEKEALHQCLQWAPGICATGGGTPCFFDNMDWMNENGLTIYLKTPEGLLADRLKKERLLRPLLAHVAEKDLEEHIRHMVGQREKFYCLADITLEQNAEDMPFFEQQLIDAINHEH